jgi:hypothetical protein
MNVSRETNCYSPHEFHMPEPYTPTPDGFERRLRGWVSLPAKDMNTPDAGDAKPPRRSLTRLSVRQCTASVQLERSGT